MGDFDAGDVDYAGRFCKCGLIESDAAWELGNRGCPDCKAVWPENLGKRTDYDGGPEIRRWPKGYIPPPFVPPSRAHENVHILYTNYRGETAHRTIRPGKLYFGSTEWHPEEQWLLAAYDVGKQASRDFAMKDILEWRPVDG